MKNKINPSEDLINTLEIARSDTFSDEEITFIQEFVQKKENEN